MYSHRKDVEIIENTVNLDLLILPWARIEKHDLRQLMSDVGITWLAVSESLDSKTGGRDVKKTSPTMKAMFLPFSVSFLTSSFWYIYLGKIRYRIKREAKNLLFSDLFF